MQTVSARVAEDIRARAEAGEAAAAVALAGRLLMGDGAPFAPEEGAAWAAKAAELGSGEGLNLCATLAAAGIGRAQTWADALDLLVRAAEAGEARAQAQLKLLGAYPRPDAAREPIHADWAGLAARVDIGAWTSSAERAAVCEAPRIREVRKFLPPEVCRWLIAQAKGKLQPSTMFSAETRRDEPHPGRTCSVFLFDVLRADVITVLVRARISATVKIPLPCFEPTQIFHYATGQLIGAHYDFLEARDMTSYGSGETYDGQRIATFLVYLNGDYEGGETVFPKAGYRFKGAAGSAIFFANVDQAGQPDLQSLHAGAPPTKGEKWIISQWIHNRPFTGMLR